MTKDEFMYDYSFDYIIYMINRYIKIDDSEEEGMRVTNISNVL